MLGYASIVVALGAVFTLAPLATDMYLPAFPRMACGLATSIDHIEATVSVFFVGHAISQLLFGPLSDRFGRVAILTVGLSLFVAGSVMSGLAANAEQLFIFRLIQALGGGASVVVFAIVTDRFDENQSPRVISYIMTLVAVAPLVAPVVGGYILITLGWQAIFFGLAGYVAITLLLVRAVLGDAEGARGRERVGLYAGLRQLVAAYRTVLSNGRAMVHILAGAFSFAGLFVFVAGSPFVYITFFGVAPQNFGYLVGANAGVMIAVNLANARLLHHINPTSKTIAGTLVLGASGIALVAANGAELGLSWIVAGVLTFVGGLGLVAANSVAGALAGFAEDSGTASAVYGVCMFGLGAVSSLVVSTIESTDPTPMIAVMAVCGVLTMASILSFRIRQGQFVA